MITAQDKILHVANKLGLTSLKDMQASTGAVYDVDTDLSGQIFSNAARHQNPSITNINENFAAGSPFTFANTANFTAALGPNNLQFFAPRHQVFMEGAGILIPPQVQWSVQYTIFNVVSGAVVAPTASTQIGCYLFGTKVLLNFNTSI